MPSSRVSIVDESPKRRRTVEYVPFRVIITWGCSWRIGASNPIPTGWLNRAMKAMQNERTGTWHLVGARGCGAEPEGDVVEGAWAEIRDRVERDGSNRCSNCRWPR